MLESPSLKREAMTKPVRLFCKEAGGMKITYMMDVDALPIRFLETTVIGVFHRTLLEYPEEAVLEAIVDVTAHCTTAQGKFCL
jgi:hypothetical protein